MSIVTRYLKKELQFYRLKDCTVKILESASISILIHNLYVLDIPLSRCTYFIHILCCILLIIPKNLNYEEYYKDSLENNLLERREKCRRKPRSHLAPLMSVIARLDVYARDIFPVPLAHSFLSLIAEKWPFDFLHRGKIRCRRLEGALWSDSPPSSR